MTAGHSHSWNGFAIRVSRGETRIQACANEDQDGRGQENDRIIVSQAEAARAAGKHERAQSIDNISQRIEMGNGSQPDGHDGGGINRVARKEQWHGISHLACCPAAGLSVWGRVSGRPGVSEKTRDKELRQRHDFVQVTAGRRP